MFETNDWTIESHGAPCRADKVEIDLAKVSDEDDQIVIELGSLHEESASIEFLSRKKGFSADGQTVNFRAGANQQHQVCEVSNIRYSILHGTNRSGQTVQSHLLTYRVKAQPTVQSLPAGYDGPPVTFSIILCDQQGSPLPEGIFVRFGVLHYSCGENAGKHFPRENETDWMLRRDHARWHQLIPDNFPFVEKVKLVFDRDGVGWFAGCG
ncbi:hypothetical protein [Ruegeria arenilitoris]|uniref:hypothetical protein n=1 Tax=Ruegeria arenilitoris TaxID=1173585 RepID=UPI0014816080|nr:hypothetical protein [Ruegeria arenilitoris]